MIKDNHMIIALNFTDEFEALRTVDILRPFVKRFKIGLPLFIKYGKKIVEKVSALDTKIFLDLKLHDIPSVISQTIENIIELDIEFLTVHLQGGRNLAKAIQQYSNSIKFLGVTVLTSISTREFNTIYNTTLEDGVLKLSEIAYHTGLYGIVCSGHESKVIKSRFPELKIVVPGIRLGRDTHDQTRVLTPCEALKNGADFIVVGRDITHQSSMLEKIKIYLKEIEECGYH